MIKQKWNVTLDNGEHTVKYCCSAFWGKTVLEVDGDKFTVRGKPFGIGLCRRESILVGGAQAVLDVAKGGKARLVCREGEVKEI